MSSVHPRIMFFEVTSGGHRLYYVEHLLEGFGRVRVPWSLVFTLGPDFADRLDSDLIRRAGRLNSVDVIYLTHDDLRRCQSGSLVRRGIGTYSVFDRYLTATHADVGFVNYLDTLNLGLAARGGRSNARVSGILHRPSPHYRELGVTAIEGLPIPQRLQEWLKRSRDSVLYPLVLRNPKVKVVLTPDPLFPEYADRHYARGSKVSSLPEPYGGEDRSSRASEPDDRVNFLLFGSITVRKGVLEILDALPYLTNQEAEGTRLIIAGHVDEGLRPTLQAKLRSARQQRPEVDIVIRDYVIPEEQLVALLTSADVVLCPYRRHVGPSGVLIWAAQFDKPVISQRFGLMGALVDRYQLGLACAPEDPRDLAECFRATLRGGPEVLGSHSRMAEFAASHNPQSFFKAVTHSLSMSLEATQPE